MDVNGWRVCPLVFVPALDKLLDLSGCRDQTIDPGIPFARADDPAGYPVALNGAGLRDDLLTVERWRAIRAARSACSRWETASSRPTANLDR